MIILDRIGFYGPQIILIISIIYLIIKQEYLVYYLIFYFISKFINKELKKNNQATSSKKY